MIIKKDNFLSTCSKLVDSYHSKSRFNYKYLTKLKKPFFLTLKSEKKFNIKKYKSLIQIYSPDNLITFKIKKKKLDQNITYCKLAVQSDQNKLLKIIEYTKGFSRFEVDKLVCKDIIKNYRKQWIKNFFLGKRGSHLIVFKKTQKILGFLLLLKKKKTYSIDLIMSNHTKQRKGVASSMIAYVVNIIMKKGDKLFAGTQKNNKAAINLYKKLGFKQYKTTYIYHLHG